MKQLRIVIVDDSDLIRDQLCKTFLPEADLSVVGTAADGLEAIRLIRELRPDIVVLDISMPLMDGIEVLREVRKDDHSTIMIVGNEPKGLWKKAFGLAKPEELIKIVEDVIADR